MNDIEAAKGLGLFSIALGMTEMAFGRRMNRGIGLGQTPGLVRALGARETVVGSMVLMHPDSAAPMWLRVAGDVIDIAVLLGALRGRNRHRDTALLSLAAVLGVTALDIGTAAALTRRHSRALATARRTRVRPALKAA